MKNQRIFQPVSKFPPIQTQKDNYPYPSNEISADLRYCTCCNASTAWAEAPSDNIITEYFRHNTMHGLKYVAEPKRHLSERLCWLLAFIMGMAAAVYMINQVWENYKRNPVIVSFKPTETDITDIPFPAVTMCNMNRVSKKFYQQVVSKTTSPDASERTTALRDLELLKTICEAPQSFAQLFNFAVRRGEVNVAGDASSWKSNATLYDILNLLVQDTDPCHEMLRLCIWSGEVTNCSMMFVPIVTEYGKCCTFNILPLPLLYTETIRAWFHTTQANVNANADRRFRRPITKHWSDEELQKWKAWDFTNDGFILDQHLERPYRQLRAGVPFGLSMLIDPNTEDYFCTSSDSEGFRIVLHTPLEAPPVSNWGVAVGLGKEIFMDVKVDFTLADSSIAGVPYEKRLCYFQAEKNLEFYEAYTTSNCLAECEAKWMAQNCNCAPFHMPRLPNVKICSSQPWSKDQLCLQQSQANLTLNFRTACPDCDSLCSDIFYHFDVTQAELQPGEILWSTLNASRAPWTKNKMSIIHLYFGEDSFVPRIRSQLYATVDLIANTGGLLGLCLGFSALSLIEIGYFFTLRLFWKKVQRKEAGMKIAFKFIQAIKRAWKEKMYATNPVMPTLGAKPGAPVFHTQYPFAKQESPFYHPEYTRSKPQYPNISDYFN